MSTTLSLHPDLPTLAHGLTTVLSSSDDASGAVTVLHREANVFTSSYPSEIVTCRLQDGRVIRLLCKYSASGHDHSGYGHWGGVGYEAAVYEHVLRHMHLSSVKYYGTYTDTVTHGTWLILEYLDAARRINKAPQPEAMIQGAQWLGHFHRSTQLSVIPDTLSFIQRYDAYRYLTWVRRTLRYAASIYDLLPWFLPLSEQVEEVITQFAAPPWVVIHGEYYGANVLYGDGTVYPIDWESAAVAGGEIDLVSQVEGWEAGIADMCIAEYRQTRWPSGVPADFQQRLATARLISAFHWLAYEPSRTIRKSAYSYFEQLRSAGEELGLL